MAAAQSYVIWDGVRRSGAAYQAGRTLIRAQVMDPNGMLGQEFEVPLSQLLSPKDTLDLRGNPNWLIHFRLLQNAYWRGVPVPAITIMAGSRGTAVDQVKVLQ